MPDTEFKVGKIALEHAAQPALALSWPAMLSSLPWKRAIESQDTTLGGRRQVHTHHNGGSNEWMVDNTTPDLGTQNYPDPDDVRVLSVARTTAAPGQRLELRALLVPCGMAERELLPGPLGSGWQGYPQGRLRLGLQWDAPGGSSSLTRTYAVPASAEANGFEGVTDGWSWDRVVTLYAGQLYPQGADEAATAVIFQEWPTLTTTISALGGIRLIAANVCELPAYHTSEHDQAASSAHDTQGQVTHEIPKTKAPDGATFNEPRFGTARAMDVGARQDAYSGPVIFEFGSYSELAAEVTDTAPDPIQVTSTSMVGLLDVTQTEWDADAPGWDICAAYCRATPTNLDTRLRDNAATVPVRIQVHARFTTDAGSETGTIRIQTSARSWVEMTIPEESTWTWYTTTEYLEANATVRDAACVVQAFALVSGGTMEVRYISANYGAYTIEIP